MTKQLVVVYCAVASLLFGSCTLSHAADSGTLVIANPGDVRSLDPHKTGSITEANIFYSLYEGLTMLGTDGVGPEPAIATSWQANTDATVWTFRLREDATWSDGRQITADDFVYSWRRIADPATESPYANLIFYVRNGEAIAQGDEKDVTKLGVRAVAPFVLEVTTQKPTAHFPAIASHYALFAVPRHAIERSGARWTQPENHVSSGPFRLVEHVPNDRVVLEQRKGHWDEASIKLRRLVFRPCDALGTALSLFDTNKTDLALDLQSLDKEPLTDLGNRSVIVVEPQYATAFYVLNLRKAPFNDPRVRRALRLAIDVEALCAQLPGIAGAPATSFVPSGPAGYTAVALPRANAEEARRLFAESGFPGGKGFPSTRILLNDSPANRKVAEVVRAIWSKELGVEVEIEALPWVAFAKRREEGDFDVARSGWVADYADPIAFLGAFRPKAIDNHAGWVDAKYVSLLDAADRELDPTARLTNLRRAETLLLDALPIIPLFRYQGVSLRRQAVRGYTPNMLGYRLFRGVSMVSQTNP
jgi:oligopeptide transport system substrate-binding protein